MLRLFPDGYCKKKTGEVRGYGCKGISSMREECLFEVDCLIVITLLRHRNFHRNASNIFSYNGRHVEMTESYGHDLTEKLLATTPFKLMRQYCVYHKIF